MGSASQEIEVKLGPIGVILLCVVAAIAPPVSAAPPAGAPFIDNYLADVHNGHAQSWAVAQDFRGVTYFANGKGILIFDGVDWRLIEMDAVLALDVDELGRVFWSNTREIGYLVPGKNGELKPQSLMGLVPEEIKNFESIRNIFATSHGVYFINKNRIFRWFNHRLTLVGEGGAYYCAKLDDEIVLFNTKPVELHIIENGKIHALKVDNQQLIKKASRTAIVSHGDRNLMLITTDRGFFVYHREHYFAEGSHVPDYRKTGQTTRPFLNRIEGADAVAHIQKHKTYKAMRIGPNRVAVGTLGGGLTIVDNKGNLQQILGKKDGLNSEIILNLDLDRQGNLWATTQDGVSYIQTSSPITRFGEKYGISEFVLSAAVTDGAVYAGTFKETLRLGVHGSFDRQKQIFQPLDEGGIATTWSFYDMAGFLLMGDDNGVNLIRDNRAERVVSTGHSSVYTMETAAHFPGVLFIGGDFRLYASKYEITPASTSRSSERAMVFGDLIELHETRENVRVISSGTNRDLWFAADNGVLYNLQLKGNDLNQPMVHEYSEIDGKPFEKHPWPFELLGEVLISSSHGFYRPTNRDIGGRYKFVAVDELNRVAPDGVALSDFVSDKEGRLWAAGDEASLGYFIQTPDGQWAWRDRRFRKLRDVYDIVFNADQSVVYTTGRSGLFRFDLTKPKTLDHSYQTIIRRVSSEQTVYLDGGYFTNPSAGATPDEISNKNERLLSLMQSPETKPNIEYDSNSLVFTYAAAFYEHPHKTRYQYYLEGNDDRWSDWSHRTEKEYQNLFEGAYCFKVRAKNIFDVTSDTASYCFEVLPPWYRTVLAYVGYAAAFGLVMLVGIRIYTRRLLRAKHRLEKKVRERTLEIKKQRDEIAHQKDQIEKTNKALWGEMELAKKIQTVLLPVDPRIPGYEITGYMRTADSVGGDYYDVIRVKDKYWLAIGDVSGHGVTAGLVMMMAQTALNHALTAFADRTPDQILTSINRVLYDNIHKLGENKYMTIMLLAIGTDGTIHYSGLHQDVLVYRSTQQKVETVQTNGMWLGVVPDIDQLNSVAEIHLDEGDALLLTTDGIVEARDNAGQMYGISRLKAVLEEQGDRSTDALRDRILESVEGYNSNDDVTMMIVKRHEEHEEKPKKLLVNGDAAD